jgi:hypothetical protein
MAYYSLFRYGGNNNSNNGIAIIGFVNLTLLNLLIDTDFYDEVGEGVEYQRSTSNGQRGIQNLEPGITRTNNQRRMRNPEAGSQNLEPGT